MNPENVFEHGNPFEPDVEGDVDTDTLSQQLVRDIEQFQELDTDKLAIVMESLGWVEETNADRQRQKEQKSEMGKLRHDLKVTRKKLNKEYKTSSAQRILLEAMTLIDDEDLFDKSFLEKDYVNAVEMLVRVDIQEKDKRKNKILDNRAPSIMHNHLARLMLDGINSVLSGSNHQLESISNLSDNDLELIKSMNKDGNDLASICEELGVTKARFLLDFEKIFYKIFPEEEHKQDSQK